MIATSLATSSGWTSGIGLAIAKTIASAAIWRTAAAEIDRGPDRPMTTSAPGMTSFAVPCLPVGFVRCASSSRIGSMFGRPGYSDAVDVGDEHLADAVRRG